MLRSRIGVRQRLPGQFPRSEHRSWEQTALVLVVAWQVERKMQNGKELGRRALKLVRVPSKKYQDTIISARGFQANSAARWLRKSRGPDRIRPEVHCDPDLPERLRIGAPLNKDHPAPILVAARRAPPTTPRWRRIAANNRKPASIGVAVSAVAASRSARACGSIVPGDRSEMRRRPVRKIKHGLVDVAPAPALWRIIRLDDGMSGRAKMLGRVPIGRFIAAADMPAPSADTQMHPL